MLKTSLCILMAVSAAWAQAGSSSTDAIRKESEALQKAVDAAIGDVGGTSLLQPAKATYVEEFGIFVSLEVALEPPRNPFTSPAAPRTASSQVSERQRLVREKVKQFLMQKAPSLQSLKAEQSIVIAVHLFNSNPVDTPNLPKQLVFIVSKQDPTRVVMREL
jgi:hypothetical protein